jgi:threonine dehydratase
MRGGAPPIYVLRDSQRHYVFQQDELCSKIVRTTGAKFLPPGEHKDVILGHGTAVHEFQQQMISTYNTNLDF